MLRTALPPRRLLLITQQQQQHLYQQDYQPSLHHHHYQHQKLQLQQCFQYSSISDFDNKTEPISAGTTIGDEKDTKSSSAPPPTPRKPSLRPRPTALTDEIIRVDHAGELGADRIYAGQMAILGNGPMGKTIAHMWEQEKGHRKQFEELISQHRVRPTVMTPIWNIAGFALGAGTALLGEKAAMACTVAVETVIVEHYNDQLRQIMETPNPDKELLATITKFRDEEQEHHDTGIECGAEQAPFYKAMTEVIKMGCKAAIAISKRV